MQIIQIEWRAWQNITKELKALGLDINAPRLDPLVKAVRLWGEELVPLRTRQPIEIIERIRVQAREVYGEGSRGQLAPDKEKEFEVWWFSREARGMACAGITSIEKARVVRDELTTALDPLSEVTYEVIIAIDPTIVG